MTNQEVNEFMQRFLDDDLNEEELELLMEHIRQSPASAALFERLQRLDSELESLPKVIPPMSIVDSILPRLELAGLIDHPPIESATASDDLPGRVIPIKPRSTIRSKVNYRLLGGVVAAGVVLTLFFSNFGPQMSFDSADEDIASTSQMKDTMVVAEGNATLNKSAEPKSSSDEQEQAMDSAPKPDQMSTFNDPAPAQSDGDAPISNDSAAKQSPSWVDAGSEARSGAEDAPIAMVSPAPSDSSAADTRKIESSPGADDTDATMDNNAPSFMMITKESSPAVASPDEKLSGLVTSTTDISQQIIISDPNGEQIYESAIYEGSLNELTWSPDSSQLHFEVVRDNEPIVHMTIDLTALTESIKVEE